MDLKSKFGEEELKDKSVKELANLLKQKTWQ